VSNTISHQSNLDKNKWKKKIINFLIEISIQNIYNSVFGNDSDLLKKKCSEYIHLSILNLHFKYTKEYLRNIMIYIRIYIT